MQTPLFVQIMHLDKRLTACADLVYGRTVADIGTDHAYIPIALVESGRCGRAFASDIHHGPVERARRNVAEHGLSEKITVLCVPGLQSTEFADCDDIVIAGMGGEMIASILKEGRDRIRANARLILQPMTKPERLRAYLWEHGYRTTDERAVYEGERIYQVFAAEQTGRNTPYTRAEALIGKRQEGDSAYAALVQKTIRTLTARTDAKQGAGRDAADERELIAQLEELL